MATGPITVLRKLRRCLDAAQKDPTPYRRSAKDFTRKRKLHFSCLFLLNLSPQGRPLLKKVSRLS